MVWVELVIMAWSGTEETHFEEPDEQTQVYSKQTPQTLWCTEDPQA